MKDKQFYIDKANEIVLLFEKRANEGFNTKISILDIIYETELLFFGFNQSYPALYDLKDLKENYVKNIGRGNRPDDDVKEHLQRFISFITDYI